MSELENYLRRIRWSAVLSVAFMALALFSMGVEEYEQGVVFGMCSIVWALLNLKDELTQRQLR